MTINQNQIEAAARAIRDAVRISIRPNGGTMELLEQGHTFHLNQDEATKAAKAAHEAFHPTATSARETVLSDVDDERQRQDAKWGEQNHPDGTGPARLPLHPITGDARYDAIELAELATQVTDRRASRGECAWKDILLEEVFEALAESDPAALRTELIQVAAVAAQWAEAIDRRNAGGVSL
ncbi:hypothetical protein [Arthrobacter sp.]|uniref:hypothetical protein n=1 Tax=Arthrobacter sp. TaxID=1667 RepID=UPI003A921F10